MFETLNELEPERESQDEKRANYLGIWIGLALLPVLVIFMRFGKEEMGMAAFTCLGGFIFAAGSRWDLRGQVSFWIARVFVLALQIPLILYMPFPTGLHRMGLLPIGIADFLISLGIIKMLEKLTGTKEETIEDQEA
jgi:hypothetical protein